MAIETREVQFENIRYPIEVTEFGIETEAKEEQFSNTPNVSNSLPMETTESGILTAVKEVHPSNAPEPIETTDAGMMMEVKEVHFLKV